MIVQIKHKRRVCIKRETAQVIREGVSILPIMRITGVMVLTKMKKSITLLFTESLINKVYAP